MLKYSQSLRLNKYTGSKTPMMVLYACQSPNCLGPVNSVAISGNNKYIVSVGSDLNAKIIDLERRSIHFTFKNVLPGTNNNFHKYKFYQSPLDLCTICSTINTLQQFVKMELSSFSTLSVKRSLIKISSLKVALFSK